MAQQLPCHAILQDGGHGPVAKLYFAMGIMRALGHGPKEHSGITAQTPSGLNGKRNKFGVIIFVPLGYSRTPTGEPVPPRVSSDLTRPTREGATYNNIY